MVVLKKNDILVYFNLCGFSIICPLKFLSILKKEKYSPYGEQILYFYSRLGFLYAETYSTIHYTEKPTY